MVKRGVAITMYLGGWMNSEGRALVRQNKNDICFFFFCRRVKCKATLQKRNEGKECVCAFVREHPKAW